MENQKNKLNQIDANFLSLARSTPTIIWTMDSEGRILDVQPSWEQYTGQKFEEYKNWGWIEMIHPNYRDEVERQWKQSVANRSFPPLSGMIWNNEHQEYRQFISSAVPILDSEGNLLEWVGMNTDVHDQKNNDKNEGENFDKLEDQIRERTIELETSIHLLEQAEQTAKLGHWRWNLTRNEQVWSPNFYHLLGCEPFDIEPSLDNFLSFVHPEDKDGLIHAAKNSFDQQSVTDEVFRIVSKNGKVKYIRGIGSIFNIGDDMYVIGTAQDVSELIDAVSQLKTSNEDLQQFAHVTSHDFKEPVRKIKLFSNRLMTEFEDAMPDRAKTYIEKIERSSERLYRMVEDILKYSSFDKEGDQITDVDMNMVMNHVVEDLEMNIQEKEADIQYMHLPILKGSPILLYQLFYNLLNNALKFTKPGRKPEICIASCCFEFENCEFTEIRVKDNGIGFDPNNAELIFKSFTRLHTRDEIDGTGLGLALCKKIVERHNGSIYALGEPGEGAEFVITLPLF